MTDAVSYLVIGFAAGYVWNPVWTVCKKIWIEIKKAREEW